MPTRYPFALAAALAAAGLVSACSETRGNAKPAAFPPAPVSVVEVKPADLPVELEYVGQTAGYREVEIRARVSGIVLKRNYDEGARVAKGQSLFRIDPAPFEAALARAEADLAGAQAREAQARRNAGRLKPLWEAKAVSQRDYDDAVSGAEIAAADVKAANARLSEARLNLEYTKVESPISGIAGRALRPEGTLVSGPEVLLTTVTQIDPMYVIFGIPDADQLRLKREAASGALRLPKGNRFDVRLTLADDRAYGKLGKLDFADVRINPATGTSEARAEIAGNDLLRPGQFVRVRLIGAMRPDAIKIPQRAVLEGPRGKFVYVLGVDSKAEARPVQVAEWSGEDWIVTEGLKAGDRVITDGVMKIGPGAPVQAAEAAPPPAPTKK